MRPCGRQHHDGGGVRVLVDPGIVLILEADGLGERVDRLRRSGQEMPAAGCAGTAVALEIVLLLCGGDGRRFLRIEADGDDVEFVADIELHHLHGAGQSGERFAAEHGAVVVDEVQDQRLFAEVVAEFDGAAGVVDESEIGRELVRRDAARCRRSADTVGGRWLAAT